MTGLGFALSRELSEMMQGDFVLESEMNKGSMFVCNTYPDKLTIKSKVRDKS